MNVLQTMAAALIIVSILIWDVDVTVDMDIVFKVTAFRAMVMLSEFFS